MIWGSGEEDSVLDAETGAGEHISPNAVTSGEGKIESRFICVSADMNRAVLDIEWSGLDYAWRHLRSGSLRRGPGL